MADATRALPGNRHDEPSSPSPEPISVAILVTTLVGHLWKADPGHSPKAPKDQYRVSTDGRSGIVNDPNREDDPEYIVRLLGQVVTVSIETVKLVGELARLGID
jgi:hypothetical protein